MQYYCVQKYHSRLQILRFYCSFKTAFFFFVRGVWLVQIRAICPGMTGQDFAMESFKWKYIENGWKKQFTYTIWALSFSLPHFKCIYIFLLHWKKEGRKWGGIWVSSVVRRVGLGCERACPKMVIIVPLLVQQQLEKRFPFLIFFFLLGKLQLLVSWIMPSPPLGDRCESTGDVSTGAARCWETTTSTSLSFYLKIVFSRGTDYSSWCC